MDLWLGLGVIIATFLGPILAVLVTRLIDQRRELRDRRMEVFRSLMGSRRATLSPERVRALNMVEIEFYGVRAVEQAYRNVMEHINIPPTPPVPGWDERLRSLMTKLLSEMAETLGYSLQQMDVLEGGYYPQAYFDIETEQREVRRSALEVLSGRRPLTVAPAAPAPPAPFPPPPAPNAR